MDVGGGHCHGYLEILITPTSDQCHLTISLCSQGAHIRTTPPRGWEGTELLYARGSQDIYALSLYPDIHIYLKYQYTVILLLSHETRRLRKVANIFRTGSTLNIFTRGSTLNIFTTGSTLNIFTTGSTLNIFTTGSTLKCCNGL